jgi:LPS export ABC transporter protein LptC
MFTLILLFFIGPIQSCSHQEMEKTGITREGRPDQESWTVTITLTSEGSKRAVVRSGHLQKFNDRQFILLDQGVNADFFDTEENHTTNLVSKIAEVDEKSDFMIAMGEVVVVSDSGVTLYTDTLSWNNEEERVYTDDPVILTTENNDTLYGIGFESDVELDNWRILEPTGVMHEDEK